MCHAHGWCWRSSPCFASFKRGILGQSWPKVVVFGAGPWGFLLANFGGFEFPDWIEDGLDTWSKEERWTPTCVGRLYQYVLIWFVWKRSAYHTMHNIGGPTIRNQLQICGFCTLVLLEMIGKLVCFCSVIAGAQRKLTAASLWGICMCSLRHWSTDALYA